jgi:two-component SAPR family response regulator
MMHILAVDDEQHALNILAEVVKNAVPGCALACFDRPDTALAHAAVTRIDIAFLDVEMGGMNGLELAKRLKDIHAKTNIIFVTGHSEYALDAFAVNAGGYLLKPVAESDILRAMEELRHPVGLPADTRLRVQCFGNFEVFANNRIIHFPRSKSKELFAQLVHKRGTSCTVKELAAVLFEDKADGARQIQTYISAMMRTLNEHQAQGAVIKHRDSLAVDTAALNCDYYRFLAGDPDAVNAYAGEYMAGYSWAEFVVDRLDRRVLKQLDAGRE